MNDNRIHLKIKIKNLADEARTIRKEERKVRGMDRWNLQHHRKTVVRMAAIRSQVAYAIIRGRDSSASASRDPFWQAQDAPDIERMVKKYGSPEAIERLKEAA